MWLSTKAGWILPEIGVISQRILKPKMIDWKEYANHYIERLKGTDSESAYHNLIEADDVIIPILIDAFRGEKDPAIRSELVEIIWQHRNPDTIEFFSEALEDPAPGVWKNALDGLVALASPRAIEVLRSAQTRTFPKQKQTDEFQGWLKEAIEQAEEKMSRKEGEEWDRVQKINEKKKFELQSLRIAGVWDPADLVNLIHDEYFCLDDIRYLSEERILVIPYRRMFHGGPRKTIREGLLFKEEEVDVIRSEMRIHHVENYEVYDLARIGTYSFNYIDFDEESSVLTFETNVYLRITIKVSEILIESEDLEIRGKSRIKYFGSIEITNGKVYE